MSPLLVLLVVGILLALFPVDPTIRKVIVAIVLILALVFLLRYLGA